MNDHRHSGASRRHSGAGWLTDWTIRRIFKAKQPYNFYRAECDALIDIGETLFRLGSISKYSQAELAAIYQEGTNGNFAVRHRHIPDWFVVTARGVHKGRLRAADFVGIRQINWDRKEIFVHAPVYDIQPSTDSLLIAKAFKASRYINVWLHFHSVVATPHKIKLNYPAIEESDWETFAALVKSGVRAINMIDHDVGRKGGANGEPDSAIILGVNAREAFELAISLIVPT